jgi:acyl dehydratase
MSEVTAFMSSKPAAGATSYRIEAYNIARQSENRIHDDGVARSFGFAGGLVPGVEVYAYATHAAVAHWGRAWLERGALACRFLKPIYDGRLAVVTVEQDGPALAVRIESDGVLCAEGRAELSAALPRRPEIEGYPRARPPAQRPPADAASLAPGTALGITPLAVTREGLRAYLRDVREGAALYAEEGLVHPGQVLRTCNLTLSQNVVLGPWIHTSSKVQNFAPARVDETLSVRARVVANYERKGHRLVDLDALVLAEETRLVAHVLHTAIYRLRPARA